MRPNRFGAHSVLMPYCRGKSRTNAQSVHYGHAQWQGEDRAGACPCTGAPAAIPHASPMPGNSAGMEGKWGQTGEDTGVKRGNTDPTVRQHRSRFIAL